MKPEIAGKLKYGSWGIIFGAIIVMVIGFVWGGWSTAATTKAMSDKAANQTAICVAQFVNQPNFEAILTEFEKVNSWERDKFIEKGGWDKMPGKEKVDLAVSQACADGLELLIKK